MSSDFQLPPFHLLERVRASAPALANLDREIALRLDALAVPSSKLAGRSIAVTCGSRGIASYSDSVRALCAWLARHGARPFLIPAMGSHGGATAEGQRQVLANYGVTRESVGAEIIASMETVSLGRTPEGFEVFMDRRAAEADGIFVFNRIKPHTTFSGALESGLHKMIAVGMGKLDGAREYHRHVRTVGWEPVLRAMAKKSLAESKIVAALGVIENEFHQVCEFVAATPATLLSVEEAALVVAKSRVPRLPFAQLDLLIVDGMGKNVSGTGMDTKIIGRGVKLAEGEAPRIRLIYTRRLTAESEGNALGVGLADLIHERLFRSADFEKTYVNVRTSLNFEMARIPMYFPSDREAIEFALAALGAGSVSGRRIAWIRNTQQLDRIFASEALVRELNDLDGWTRAADPSHARFNSRGDFVPVFD